MRGPCNCESLFWPPWVGFYPDGLWPLGCTANEAGRSRPWWFSSCHLLLDTCIAIEKKKRSIWIQMTNPTLSLGLCWATLGCQRNRGQTRQQLFNLWYISTYILYLMFCFWYLLSFILCLMLCLCYLLSYIFCLVCGIFYLISYILYLFCGVSYFIAFV